MDSDLGVKTTGHGQVCTCLILQLSRFNGLPSLLLDVEIVTCLDLGMISLAMIMQLLLDITKNITTDHLMQYYQGYNVKL